MDHTITTRWGGRKGRYAEFGGSVGRCFDPFDKQPVEFEHPIEYEAWIRQRFDPGTTCITHKRTTIAAKEKGRDIVATATFVVTKASGSKQFHLIAKRFAPRSQLAQLRRVAAQDGAVVVVSLLTDLRADIDMFWRLERLRQAATLHFGEGQELDNTILRAIDDGASSRVQVCEALRETAHQLIDARLAYMHVAGHVVLDLTKEDFGVSTTKGRGAP